MRVVVIGCGNPYATDDAVGLLAVKKLQEEPLPKGATVIEAGCPGLNLLDLWAPEDKVLLIDAVRSGSEPGTIHLFGPDSLPPREFLPVSLHGINLIDAISLGKVMGKLPATLKILGVEILSEEPFREGLTEAVAAALPELCRRARGEIKRMLTED